MSDEETQLKLWVLHATNAQGNGAWHACYARTESEARQREMPWMAQRVNEGFSDIDVRHYPSGFNDWPGSVPASEVKP